MSTKVLVIGGSGLAGQSLLTRLSNEGFEVTATYNTTQIEETTVQLDKRDGESVWELITSLKPNIVVDFAAFHDVDECETRRKEAWSVNVAGTQNVAAATAEVDADFVYLSTDYVFSGDTECAPYTERDPVNPVNYYGQTKFAGEQAAKIVNSWTILRSSVLYGIYRRNFLIWVHNMLRTNDRVEVIRDQISTVTYAADIAEACVRVVKKDLCGLYHAAGPKPVSRYEFAQKIATSFGYSPQAVVPISSDKLDRKATRPPNSSLDSTKLYEDIGYRFREPETALGEIYP